jgi:hypothetical protein
MKFPALTSVDLETDPGMKLNTSLRNVVAGVENEISRGCFPWKSDMFDVVIRPGIWEGFGKDLGRIWEGRMEGIWGDIEGDNRWV